MVHRWGFQGSSPGKESACNVGDPGSIPGLGSSSGEGIGCPLQYSWVSLVAQTVRNLPAMPEAWVQSLGWEDPLEKGMATHSRLPPWRIPMDRGAWQDPGPRNLAGASSMGSQRVGHDRVTKHIVHKVSSQFPTIIKLMYVLNLA